MVGLIDKLQRNKQFREIVCHLREGMNCAVNGLWGSSASFFIAAVANERVRITRAVPKVLLVVSGIEEAQEDTEDLNTFFHGHASLFPASENIFLDDFEDEDDTPARRLQILNRMLHGDIHADDKLDIVVAPIQSLLQPVPSSRSISENVLRIQKNREYPLEKLIAWLQEHHYRLTCQVENAGEYALRGGIVDIFPFASDVPCRIEYFGDEIESIRRFHVESQLSERELDACQILSHDKIYRTMSRTQGTFPSEGGVKEERKLAEKGDCPGDSPIRSEHEKTSLLTYLSKDTWIVLKEPARIEDRARRALDGMDDKEALFKTDEIFRLFSAFKKIALSKLPLASNNGDYTFQVKSVDNFPQHIQEITSELGKVIEANDRTVVFCNNKAEEQRFQEIISSSDMNDNGRFALRIGHLSRGFQFSDIRVAFLAHHEIFHRYQQRRESKKPVHARALDSFLDLKKGDYVVHISHGIGRFLGMETLEDEGHKREYLVLEFDEGTKIYVPATKIELVQKYIGGSDHRPRLDKIGSKYWEVRKKRAENAIADVASDLLHMQALRNAKEGIAYPADTEWQREFEESFIYEETPDQLEVIKDIKCDMESKMPMDRLICGDVGYGKTELAMRAAFKAVMFGKQVAVLVPTTILAQQHFVTFSERMADYPVKIGVLSRFKTRGEQKETLEKTAAGSIDILIGTHRLLQKDVYFKRPGSRDY